MSLPGAFFPVIARREAAKQSQSGFTEGKPGQPWSRGEKGCHCDLLSPCAEALSRSPEQSEGTAKGLSMRDSSPAVQNDKMRFRMTKSGSE